MFLMYSRSTIKSFQNRATFSEVHSSLVEFLLMMTCLSNLWAYYLSRNQQRPQECCTNETHLPAIHRFCMQKDALYQTNICKIHSSLIWNIQSSIVKLLNKISKAYFTILVVIEINSKLSIFFAEMQVLYY